MARVLLQADADVNVSNTSGLTPLHIAARLNPATFPVLLEFGADLEALDGEGRTPLDYARRNAALAGLDIVRRP